MADSEIQNRDNETVLIDIDRRVGATQHLPGSAWRASDLTEADWQVRIPEAAL